MSLTELYTRKGELVTTVEFAQAQLREVNNEIVKQLNKKDEPQKSEAPVIDVKT